MLNTPLHDREPRFFRLVRLLSVGDLLLPLALMIVSFGFLMATLGSSKISVVKKDPLITSITTAISNGADLSVVRHIYKQRKQERSSLLLTLFARSQETYRSDDFYSADTPISDILLDIRTNQFLAKRPDGTTLLDALDRLIREHAQANPFDKLEPGQRETFENVRAKLATNYDIVQNDIARIGDELHGKNVAVEKYLRDSTFNLWLSIFALFMSLVISAYQIFQSREKRAVRLYRQAIEQGNAPSVLRTEA